MFTFGDFKHELDYILLNGYQCDIFSKHSLINGKLQYVKEVKQSKCDERKLPVQRKEIKKLVKYFGINNYENCCFLNSTLQLILNYPQFISALKRYELSTQKSSNIIEAILNYYDQICPTSINLDVNKLEDCIVYFGSKLPSLNPCLDLVSMLGFTKNKHEDAEEFLTKLLTKIHEDLLSCDFGSISPEHETVDEDSWVEIGKRGKNLSPPREDGGEMLSETALSELVSGKMIEKIMKRNHAVMSTSTPFFILPLNIQHNNVVDIRSGLSYLTATEKLSESTERCMQIGHLPPLLIIQLKRFTFSKEVGIEKIQKKILINSTLSIPQECISSTITEEQEVSYQLFGIVFHIGEGVTKGHYTAAIKDGDIWYYLDDSNVFLVQGKQSIEWLLHSSLAEIPVQSFSLDMKIPTTRSSCVSGRRSPYLIFYSKSK